LKKWLEEQNQRKGVFPKKGVDGLLVGENTPPIPLANDVANVDV